MPLRLNLSVPLSLRVNNLFKTLGLAFVFGSTLSLGLGQVLRSVSEVKFMTFTICVSGHK